MSDIRLLTLPDLPVANEIRQNAYPTMEDRSPKGQQRSLDRLAQQLGQDDMQLFGLFRNEELQGVMKLYDFTMNFMGQFIPVGGLGGVAVSILHKKRGVAREMVQFFQRHYEERGYPLTALYPFRPDFYRQMGFGYGPRRVEYRVKPAGIQATKDEQQHLSHLPLNELAQLQACYHRVYKTTHGMIEHDPRVFRLYHSNLHNRLLVYKPADDVEGYLIYRFSKITDDNMLKQRIDVREFVYENPAALKSILAFLKAQVDQVEEIKIITEDPALHYCFTDPRDLKERVFPSVTHQIGIAGLGMMYKITSIQNLLHALKEHRFGHGEITINLQLENSFQPEYGGPFTIKFANGVAALQRGSVADVTLQIEMANFSALLLGCVNLADLCRLGLATVDNPDKVGQLDSIFRLPNAPISMTDF